MAAQSDSDCSSIVVVGRRSYTLQWQYLEAMMYAKGAHLAVSSRGLVGIVTVTRHCDKIRI